MKKRHTVTGMDYGRRAVQMKPSREALLTSRQVAIGLDTARKIALENGLGLPAAHMRLRRAERHGLIRRAGKRRWQGLRSSHQAAAWEACW